MGHFHVWPKFNQELNKLGVVSKNAIRPGFNFCLDREWKYSTEKFIEARLANMLTYVNFVVFVRLTNNRYSLTYFKPSVITLYNM